MLSGGAAGAVGGGAVEEVGDWCEADRAEVTVGESHAAESTTAQPTTSQNHRRLTIDRILFLVPSPEEIIRQSLPVPKRR
jgi:hypothetical protein